MRVSLGPLNKVMRILALGSSEAAGILLGAKRGGLTEVYAVYITDNIKNSPVEFESDPWQVVQAHRASENLGVEVVGIFHTHTSCPAEPSRKDLEGMARWPYLWVISCPGEVRAWEPLEDGGVRELPIG
ncbi:MAG: M67 family metallopeptidase [Aeropyrum sp.]|nr:M67 family metallopeptidase [Aeropyrum sp.]MCE4616427.1 M67 family metallopeptidase [Aeropyrum sp.]